MRRTYDLSSLPPERALYHRIPQSLPTLSDCLSVCLSVRLTACLLPLAFPLTPLSPFLCQLEDAQPHRVRETTGDPALPAMRGHGLVGREPRVSPNIVHFPLKTPSSSSSIDGRGRPLSSSLSFLPFTSLTRSPFSLPSSRSLSNLHPLSLARSIDRGNGGDGICRAHNSLDVADSNEIEIGKLIGVLRRVTKGGEHILP